MGESYFDQGITVREQDHLVTARTFAGKTSSPLRTGDSNRAYFDKNVTRRAASRPPAILMLGAR